MTETLRKEFALLYQAIDGFCLLQRQAQWLHLGAIKAHEVDGTRRRT